MILQRPALFAVGIATASYVCLGVWETRFELDSWPPFISVSNAEKETFIKIAMCDVIS